MAVLGGFSKGYHTESAGTIITELIPSIPGSIARITNFSYRVAATAHALTLMRPLADTVTGQNAASGQLVIVLENLSPGSTSDGNVEPLAAADFIAWRDVEGNIQFDVIASVSGNSVTMTSNLPTAVDNGAKVWAFYEVGRSSHLAFNSHVSVTRAYPTSFQAGIATQVDNDNERSGEDDPLIFHSNNVTAAGFLEGLSGVFVHTSQVNRT